MVAWFSIAPDDDSGSYGKYVAEAITFLAEGELERKVDSALKKR